MRIVNEILLKILEKLKKNNLNLLIDFLIEFVPDP